MLGSRAGPRRSLHPEPLQAHQRYDISPAGCFYGGPSSRLQALGILRAAAFDEDGEESYLAASIPQEYCGPESPAGVARNLSVSCRPKAERGKESVEILLSPRFPPVPHPDPIYLPSKP